MDEYWWTFWSNHDLHGLNGCFITWQFCSSTFLIFLCSSFILFFYSMTLLRCHALWLRSVVSAQSSVNALTRLQASLSSAMLLLSLQRFSAAEDRHGFQALSLVLLRSDRWLSLGMQGGSAACQASPVSCFLFCFFLFAIIHENIPKFKHVLVPSSHCKTFGKAQIHAFAHFCASQIKALKCANPRISALWNAQFCAFRKCESQKCANTKRRNAQNIAHLRISAHFCAFYLRFFRF